MVALLIQIEEIDFKGKQKIVARINNFHDETTKDSEKQLVASTEELVTSLLSDLIKNTKVISHDRWEDDLEKQDAPTPKPNPDVPIEIPTTGHIKAKLGKPEMKEFSQDKDLDEWELNGVKGKWSNWPKLKYVTCDANGCILGFPMLPKAYNVAWLEKNFTCGETFIGNGPAIKDDSWKTMILKRPEGV